MNHHNVWLVENRLFVGYYAGEITTQTLIEGQQEVQHVLDNATDGRLIHAIVDMRFLVRYPTNLNDLIRATPIFKSPALGWVVLLSNNTLIRFLTSAVIHYSKPEFRAFMEIQKALDFLHEMDSEIPCMTEADYKFAIERLTRAR